SKHSPYSSAIEQHSPLHLQWSGCLLPLIYRGNTSPLIYSQKTTLSSHLPNGATTSPLSSTIEQPSPLIYNRATLLLSSAIEQHYPLIYNQSKHYTPLIYNRTSTLLSSATIEYNTIVFIYNRATFSSRLQ
ncbi:hypothetical protein RRG08_052644, partial [Elysia crispata]